MKAPRFFACLCVAVLSIAAASPALALANRVFVSARSGTDELILELTSGGPRQNTTNTHDNACDNVNTPCQTFAWAVTQLNPDGEVIVLDSGDYGPVTITKGVTIEAPAGVIAFIHPPSGDAITVNAGLLDRVTLRGLTLNVGTSSGIVVNSVGTLNVENCFLSGFGGSGILMLSAGRLNVKGTDIKECTWGVQISNSAGVAQAAIDHCHLDSNLEGFAAMTKLPGGSTTTGTYTTANNNLFGWICGISSSGTDVLNLEFCTGSENFYAGLSVGSNSVQSVVRYSNCVFANNTNIGVQNIGFGTVETRGNSTITGNGIAATNGTIGSFSPM